MDAKKIFTGSLTGKMGLNKGRKYYMKKSNFDTDLSNESIIKSLIKKRLREIGKTKIFESSSDEDRHGSDIKVSSVEIFHDTNIYHIDLKSATNYRKVVGNSSIPTFAFELQFLNEKKEVKDGWLYGDQYSLTDYYLLSWVWVETEEKTKPWIELKESDIAEIEYLIVPKKAITDYLKKYEMKKENYKNKINDFKKQIIEYYHGKKEYAVCLKMKNGKYKSAELSLSNPKKYKNCVYKTVHLPKLFYSVNLPEKPINVVIEKTVLKDLGIYSERFSIKND